MKIQAITCKSVLVRSKLPDTDYVVNPYTGCEFGCAYCYASFMGRFVQEQVQNWGNYVYVKTNAISVLADELRRLPPARRGASILLSSVTDPYQGVEARYQLTRGILSALAAAEYPGRVSILTKSPLVLRDLDILKSFQTVEVGITVTTTDDQISRWLEIRAPLAGRRLKTLKQLNAAGIPTYAFIGPLLPHFRYERHLLEELFARLADAGVKSVYVEHMNLRRYIRERLSGVLKHEKPELQAEYRQAGSLTHRHVLDSLVRELVDKYGLRLRLSTILHHAEEF